jgi:hypothetical protein
MKGDERTQKGREFIREAYAGTYSASRQFLKPEQMKRLAGIHLQWQGAQALAYDENVQQHLHLTAEQKSAVTTIVQDATAEMREMVQKKGREAAHANIVEYRKETLAKAEALLTQEQKAKWRRLLGAPFEVPLPLGRGFGGP